MASFMYEAASAGDAETLRRLLDQGVSPEDVALLYGGRTPLHWLCYCSNEGGDRIACFELLRAAGANLDATDRKGCVPLHYAVQRRSSSLASLLIEAGANVNVTNSNGTTPLHDAAKGHETTVAILVKAGAEVNAKDDWGKRPLHNARDYDNTRICHILLRAGATLVPCPKCEPPRPHLPLSRRTSTEQYLRRVTDAGGFKEYRHNHLVKFTSTCSSKLRLPAAPARLVAEFWAHAGYY